MMKKIKCVLILFTLFGFIFTACSSSEETTVKDDAIKIVDKDLEVPELDLKINQIYCWVDLMPGGPNRFHISGDLVLRESYKFELKFTNLQSVKIYQNEKEIYSIKPKVKLNEQTDFKAGKSFVFSTIKGLKLNSKFSFDVPVDVKFIFNENGDLYEHKIFNQKVEKVY